MKMAKGYGVKMPMKMDKAHKKEMEKKMGAKVKGKGRKK